MIHFIKNIVSVSPFKVTCLFNTGEEKVIDLSDTILKYQKINDGLISQLGDAEYFKSVFLDSYGTLCWDNGVDFCPDVLYNSTLKH